MAHAYPATADQPTTDLVSKLAADHLERWLGWVDAAEQVPADEQAALAADDLLTRRNIAERDPANEMGDRFFGPELTNTLVRALLGRRPRSSRRASSRPDPRECPGPRRAHADPRPGVEAPYDTVHVTVRYPALPARDYVERMSGALAADADGAPFPVVVLVPGVNVPPTPTAGWPSALVEAGNVCVGYDWVGGSSRPVRTDPGVDIVAAGPDHCGERPTTPALRPVLDAVAALNESGPLAGLLDLQRESASSVTRPVAGRCVLQSPRPAWFPEVRAVVTYGAHTMASQMIGYPPGTLLHAPVEAPTMIIAGTDDGVVAASAIRYGEQAGAAGHNPVERTWREAVPRADGVLAGPSWPGRATCWPRTRRTRPPRAGSWRRRPTPTTTASARCSATSWRPSWPRTSGAPSARSRLDQLD